MYLGQHFLKNKLELKKIVKALEIKPGDLIIEIGAGHGELTTQLIKINTKLKIIAIEKDRKLVQFLKKKFQNKKNIKIISGDVLKVLPALVRNFNSYKIVGNIPYYITGRLLRILSELKPKPKLVVLTVQKEVAKRLTALPPKMNLLSATVQFWAKPKILDYIPRKDFKPPPKVDSAIIKLKTKNLRLKAEQVKKYYQFVKILFRYPRKNILNNLLSKFSSNSDNLKSRLKSVKVKPESRAQSLNINQIKKLVKAFTKAGLL